MSNCGNSNLKRSVLFAWVLMHASGCAKALPVLHANSSSYCAQVVAVAERNKGVNEAWSYSLVGTALLAGGAATIAASRGETNGNDDALFTGGGSLATGLIAIYSGYTGSRAETYGDIASEARTAIADTTLTEPDKASRCARAAARASRAQ